MAAKQPAQPGEPAEPAEQTELTAVCIYLVAMVMVGPAVLLQTAVAPVVQVVEPSMPSVRLVAALEEAAAAVAVRKNMAGPGPTGKYILVGQLNNYKQ